MPQTLHCKCQLKGLKTEDKFIKSTLHVNKHVLFNTKTKILIICCCFRYGNKFHKHKHNLNIKETRMVRCIEHPIKH